MNKLIALLAVVALMLGLTGSALAADEELPHTGRLLIAAGGDIDVAAGEQADAVIVVDGTAHIEGTVNSLLVIDGVATVDRGTIETLAVVNSTAELGADATVRGDVLRFGSTVERAEGAAIGGEIRDMTADVVALGLFGALTALAVWVGIGIATLIAGLLVAGLAARQVRRATDLIGREPGMTLLAGLLAIVVPPIIAVLAIVTIIGMPAGIGLLVVVMPAVAFIGYIVAAIWIGEWLLGRRANAARAERPYAAATVGLLVAFVLGLVPVVTAVLSIFGIGAVVLATLRTLRRGGSNEPALHPTAAPA